LANSGDLFNAVKTFDKALEIDPDDNNTKTNREMLVEKIVNDNIVKGYDNLVNGNYSESSKYYDIVLEVQPENIDALINKGNLSFFQKNYLETLKFLDKAIEINPEHSILWANNAEALEEMGTYNEAITCFEKVIEIFLNVIPVLRQKKI
jgi:tetratricopeptide (TPR) repeat protein